MPPSKSDNDVGLMSNHIIISSENFRSHLGMMITSVLTHGYQHKTVLLATIAYICDGADYRGITICSSISKLLDLILIIRYKDKLYTGDMQLAFKEKYNTTL